MFLWLPFRWRQVLRLRLIADVRGRVQGGEMTERCLTRLTGISQPHLHNIINGVRSDG